MEVLFHADDYGYTLNTSKGILECIKAGTLDSFSVICNTSYFDRSKELFLKEIPNFDYLPKIAVHLNLVEGFSLADSKLLSKDKILNMSWGKVLLTSFTNNRELLKIELKNEIKAQIIKVNEFVNEAIKIANDNNIPVSQTGIRIDSHTHTHPIPIVWSALVEVIEEEGLKVEYIRNPKEPITPFINKYLKTFRPINFVKNFILNVYSHKIDKYCLENNIPTMYMWGLIMSGKMDEERCAYIFPKMIKKTARTNRGLEILAHPGIALNREVTKELSKENVEFFNLSKDRDVERNMVLNRYKVTLGE